jgi:translation initiation factor RLI1
MVNSFLSLFCLARFSFVNLLILKCFQHLQIKQTESEFDAKPMVMLLGQYSTGKTTFIKHLLGTSYPGKGQDGVLDHVLNSVT